MNCCSNGLTRWYVSFLINMLYNSKMIYLLLFIMFVIRFMLNVDSLNLRIQEIHLCKWYQFTFIHKIGYALISGMQNCLYFCGHFMQYIISVLISIVTYLSWEQTLRHEFLQETRVNEQWLWEHDTLLDDHSYNKVSFCRIFCVGGVTCLNFEICMCVWSTKLYLI